MPIVGIGGKAARKAQLRHGAQFFGAPGGQHVALLAQVVGDAVEQPLERVAVLRAALVVGVDAGHFLIGFVEPLLAAGVSGDNGQFEFFTVGVENGAFDIDIDHGVDARDDPHRAPGAAVLQCCHQLAGKVTGLGIAHLGTHHLILVSLVKAWIEGDYPQIQQLRFGDHGGFLLEVGKGGGFDGGGAAARQHQQGSQNGRDTAKKAGFRSARRICGDHRGIN